MSVTAVGVHTDLDGPLPVARRFSLLETPGIVKEQAGPDDTPRWMNGVVVDGYPAGTPKTWEPCSTGTTREKDDTAVEGEVDPFPGSRFDPIAVYFPAYCSTHGMGSPRTFINRVEAALDATLSHAVERALATGVQFSTNPFILDSNFTALAGGAAVSPQTGLGYLENAIGSLTGRQGLIHATPAINAAWGFGDAINPSNDPVDEPPPALGLRTPNGTPVISGSGYIDASGPGPEDATEDWAFATGPVEVRFALIYDVDLADVIDRSDNTIVYRAERYVLVEWDQALQVGVLIDWSL